MAGSVTVTKKYMSVGDAGHGITKITIAWTADSADGSVPDTDLVISGFIRRVTTNPGSPAPTGNYDITLIDEDGMDLFTGGGANRHTTTSETFVPAISGVVGTFGIIYSGTATFNLNNNSVNSAVGTVTLFISSF